MRNISESNFNSKIIKSETRKWLGKMYLVILAILSAIQLNQKINHVQEQSVVAKEQKNSNINDYKNKHLNYLLEI